MAAHSFQRWSPAFRLRSLTPAGSGLAHAHCARQGCNTAGGVRLRRLKPVLQLLFLSACASNAPLGAAEPDFKLKAEDRIVFLGDSITQAGVKAGGYVTLVQEALAEKKKEKEKNLRIEVIGAG